MEHICPIKPIDPVERMITLAPADYDHDNFGWVGRPRNILFRMAEKWKTLYTMWNVMK